LDEPTIIAGGRSPRFKDVAPPGGLLIGLEIGRGKFGPFDTVTAFRPIYRVNGKEEFGAQRGTRPASPVTIKAKEGYAVGAISYVAGLNFDGCSLTFMKVKDGKLDPSDAYESEWVGQETNRPTRIGGDGTPVVGIAGRGREGVVNGFGLLFKGQENFSPEAPPLEELVVAGGGNPLFKEVAPKDGLLIGLEIGLGKFFDQDVIKAVRPIYRVNGKEELGTQRGPRLDGAVTIKAKEGYAVGAMTCKSGLNFDGCSLTFMKVTDGKLDPSDAYESDWVGWQGNKQPRVLTGGGMPAVGIVGRGSEREVNGLGLVFNGQARGGPDAPAARPKAAPGVEPFIFGTVRDPKFKSVGPKGGVLIGLEAKFVKFGRHDIVRAVRPIYRVGGKEENGPLTGADLVGAVKLKAKDGYAVGGMSAKADLWCHGFSLTYMKVKPDGSLDPKANYESEWVGWNGEMEIAQHTGNGTPAVGLVGKIARKDTTCLGLMFKGQEGFDTNLAQEDEKQIRSVPIGKEPLILGSIRDPMFKTVGPEGAVLIGLEARFAKFGEQDIVRAVRPIYRVAGKEESGKQFGDDLTGSVTLKAKEGYAVGAISGKSKLWCHGFSLTFMKVKPDGTLDPRDAYESEWVGWNGSMPVIRVGGDGTPVVGIVGKIVRTETTALGLLFKGQEGFDSGRE
jgi:hypothetical protein